MGQLGLYMPVEVPLMTLSALIARVEEGSGWDSALDKDILRAFGFTWRGMAYWSADNKHTWEGETCFTAKVDAVLSLIEQKLPSSGWLVTRQGKEDGFFVHAAVTADDQHANVNSATAVGISPARALLAATLRAIQSKEPHDA